MRPQIKFAYFDVGGVALIDFSGNDGWNSLLTYWGITESNRSQFDAIWEKYSNRNCVQSRAVEEISKDLLALPGFLPNKSFDFVKDFVDRFEVNESIKGVIQRLHQLEIPIGLLTNMYQGMLKIITNKKLISLVDYEVVVDSSKEKQQKPNPAIYQIAQERCGFSGNQILFIDNVQKNLIPAQKLGWQTFLYDSKNPLKATSDLSTFLFPQN